MQVWVLVPFGVPVKAHDTVLSKVYYYTVAELLQRNVVVHFLVQLLLTYIFGHYC